MQLIRCRHVGLLTRVGLIRTSDNGHWQHAKLNIKQSTESVRAAAPSNRRNECHNTTLFDLYFAHSTSSLFKPTTMAAVRGWPALQHCCTHAPTHVGVIAHLLFSLPPWATHQLSVRRIPCSGSGTKMFRDRTEPTLFRAETVPETVPVLWL